jgi:NTP pyrophosphatase (non-canonical NTP hydrolase)
MSNPKIKKFQKPNAAERERIDLMQEECAEVIQILSKIKRFGFDDTKPGQPLTNRERLEEELGHVLNMFEMMVRRGDVEPDMVEQSKTTKAANIYMWLTSQ